MGTRAGRIVLLAIAAFFALTAGKAMAAPSIESEPQAMNFGDRVVDAEYSDRYVDVFGIEIDPVQITGLELTGADQDDFSFSDLDCEGAEVDQDVYCSFYVGFAPLTTGVKSASVRIETVTGDPLLVPLSGTGALPADNAPALSTPILKAALTDTSDLWGFSGGDFEGEGRTGVVAVAQMDDFSVKASFANGQPDGVLTTPIGRDVSAGGFAGSAVTGDFDGDADIDAVAAGGGGAKVYLNDGTGEMSAGTDLPIDDVDGIDGNLTAGDFNDDGIEDVLGGYGTYDDLTDEHGYMLQLFPGNEGGTFDEPISQQTPIDMPMGMATGDFDDGGLADFTATAYDGKVYMYVGDGLGGFTQVGALGPTCGCASPWGVATGDLNEDGRDDVIATLRFEDELAIFISQDDGTFSRGQRISVPLTGGWNPNPYSVSVGDLNGDRIPDVVTGDYLSDTATVFVGNGDGTISFAETLVPDPLESFLPHGTFIGDFNGDKKLDPSVASQMGPVAVFLNEGEPGQVPAPASVDFGTVESGTTSTPVTVKLKNEGGLAELRLTDVSIGGGSSGEFAFAGSDCGTDPIPVGQECEVFLVFKPVGPAGERDSSLYFDTNHSESTQVEVPLAGTVIEPPPPAPDLSISPAGHDFGSVQVGSASAARSFSVKSTGDLPLSISAVNMEGATSEFNLRTNDCVATLQPGESCSVSLEFKPSSAGAMSAAVHFVTNVAGNPARISLSGTGTALPPPPPAKPKVVIKKRPKATIRIRTRVLKQARVAFRSSLAGSKFQCRIDNRKFRGCKSPLILRKVKPGRHVVRIRAATAGVTGPVKVIGFKVIRRR